MNRRAFVLIVVLLLALLAGSLYLLANYFIASPQKALFTLQTGTATLTNAQPITPDQPTEISAKDQLDINGNGILTFSDLGLEIAIQPGTRLSLVRYERSGQGAKIELSLETGEIRPRMNVSAIAAEFSVVTNAAIISAITSTTQGHDYIIRHEGEHIEVGLVSGEARVNSQKKVVVLHQGQGTTVLQGEPPHDAESWSLIRTPIYRPDGTIIVLPVNLTRHETNQHYNFRSDQLYLVRSGTFDLEIGGLIQPYRAPNIELKTGALNELPVTLSEIVLSLADSESKPISFDGELAIQGATQMDIGAGKTMLISPGNWTLAAVRKDRPDALQNMSINLAPGERHPVLLRDDLFGGGALTVNLSPELVSAVSQPMTVEVFLPGSEDDPITTFKSDDHSDPLPQGKYIVRVRLPSPIISPRYEVKIEKRAG